MKRYRSGTTIIVICLAVLLVAGAFLLPSGLFELQDRARAQQSTTGVREKVSLENLAENYEQSLHNRMSILAERLGDERNTIYVSESEVTLTEDKKVDFLSESRYYDISPFYAEGHDIFDLYLMRKTKEDLWKCYVIYDTQGILLVCYYIELQKDGEVELQLLADAEDGTFYYQQGVRHEQYIPEGVEYEDSGVSKAKVDVKKKDMNSWLYRWLEDISYTEVDFWEVFLNFLIYYEVDYMEGAGYKEQYNYREEMSNHILDISDKEFAVYLGEKYPVQGFGSDDDWWMRMEWGYGDSGLTWEIDNGGKRVYGDGGRAEFFQGFPVLAELIPEYQDYEIQEN